MARTLTPLDAAEDLRKAAWDRLSTGSRQSLGQFFTPAPLARLIASRLRLERPNSIERPIRILDPGAGVGSLGAALVQRIADELPGAKIALTAIELDQEVFRSLEEVRRVAERWAGSCGVELDVRALHVDFVEWASTQALEDLFPREEPFDLVIMNPPYTKISTRSRHRRLTSRAACDVTNLYASFVVLGLGLLREGGQLAAITPRSFTNGPYFRAFREHVAAHAVFESVDLFESRSSLFSDAAVLQENVVYSLRKSHVRPGAVQLHFHGQNGSTEHTSNRYDSFMPSDDSELFIYLRNGSEDHETAKKVNTLPCRLSDLGLTVSTGRVVDFRSREHLRQEADDGAAPLLYPHHLRGGQVTWPLTSAKPNAIAVNADTKRLLFPSGDYVAVKRFTSKEERRRVVPTWVRSAVLGERPVAFENHLNVFHRDGAGLNRDLAVGMTLFLASSTVDRYLRQFSGHTQVNATDLRSLHYPDPPILERLGEQVPEPSGLQQEEVDAVVNAIVWNDR